MSTGYGRLSSDPLGGGPDAAEELVAAVNDELRLLGGSDTSQGREALELARRLPAEVADPAPGARSAARSMAKDLEARFLDLQLNRPGGPMKPGDFTTDLNAASRRRMAATMAVVEGIDTQPSAGAEITLSGAVALEVALLQGEDTPDGRSALALADRLDNRMARDSIEVPEACRLLNQHLFSLVYLRGYPRGGLLQQATAERLHLVSERSGGRVKESVPSTPGF